MWTPRPAVAARPLATLVAAAGLSATLPAQVPDPDRPQAARRVVHQFDFEEHKPDPSGLTNPDPVPRYWERIWSASDRPTFDRGFPQWNEARFDRKVSHSGEASVLLPSKGGSTRLSLAPGVIPVFAKGDYLVSAFVRTEGMRTSRAFVVARFLDQDKKPIPGAEARSEPIESSDRWSQVMLELPGKAENAVFLQIDLELLQASRFLPAGSLGANAVRLDDIGVSAWFDDISVCLIPRTELYADASGAGGVFLAPDRPLLHFHVRDMVGEPLTAQLSIIDAAGRTVTSHSAPVDPNGKVSDYQPELAAYGWYRAVLDTVTSNEPVGRSAIEFLYLPPHPAASPRTLQAEAGRFGVVADDSPTAPPESLPRLLSAGRAGFVVLNAQFADQRLLDTLMDHQREVTLACTSIPAGKAGSDGAWLAPLNPVLERFGQRLLRWQIGLSGAEHLLWRAEDPQSAVAFRAGIGQFVPGPVVTIPWRADLAPPAGGLAAAGADAASIFVPYAFPPDTLGATYAAWLAACNRQGASPAELTLVFDVPPWELFGRKAAAADLVKRVTELWVAVQRSNEKLLPRLAVRDAWRPPPPFSTAVAPSPHLAAWRTIVDRFAGRRVAAELHIAPGVRCVVLEDRVPDGHGLRTGTIVAWNQSADPDRAVFSGYLGGGEVALVDLYGNATPLSPDNEQAKSYTIRIPETPIFIDGVDPAVARFVSAFRVEPGFARAVIAQHEHTIVLENPWPFRVTGKFQIVEPADGVDGWSVSPRAPVAISMPPGGSQRIPFTFSFGPSQETGPQPVTALVQLEADRTIPPMELRAAIDIGLPDLELSADAIPSPKDTGPDVTLTAVVTNRGVRTRTLRLTAMAPGFSTQEHPISNLAPGEMTIRKFVFRGAATKLSSRKIRLSLGDIDAPERLNTSVAVP